MINATVRHRFWCKFCKLLLLLSWIFGLISGIALACASEEFLIPLIRSSVGQSVSALGLLASTVLPFLLSAYAVSFSEPWLLLPVSAFKAFSFGFCACGIHLAFGTAGWLVRVLFLFSDFFVIPILFFYWLHSLAHPPKKPDRVMVACISVAVAIGMIDYFLIAPFLVRLIEF